MCLAACFSSKLCEATSIPLQSPSIQLSEHVSANNIVSFYSDKTGGSILMVFTIMIDVIIT